VTYQVITLLPLNAGDNKYDSKHRADVDASALSIFHPPLELPQLSLRIAHNIHRLFSSSQSYYHPEA